MWSSQWRSQGLPGWATRPPEEPKWGRKLEKFEEKYEKNYQNLRKKWGKWNSCPPGTVRLATALDHQYLEKPIHIVCWTCTVCHWSSVGKFFCWPWSMIAYLTMERSNRKVLCFSSTFRWGGLMVWIGLYTVNIIDLYTEISVWRSVVNSL